MNVFGIGGLELLVILLVAFVALGPGKTVEVARTIGRMAREARRTFTDIMDAASLSDINSEVRRDQSNSNPGPGAPAQPPTDPLPMPPHLSDHSDSPPAPPQDADSGLPPNSGPSPNPGPSPDQR